MKNCFHLKRKTNGSGMQQCLTCHAVLQRPERRPANRTFVKKGK